jgi:4a-hydroxytetrahydrobiopterin dehydratase
MARPVALDAEALDRELSELEGWSLVDGKLHAELSFADFASAFGFMSAAAIVAAEMDHHPEWTNVYSRVTVDLVTHDAGGITDLDVALARRMTDLAAATSRRS